MYYSIFVFLCLLFIDRWYDIFSEFVDIWFYRRVGGFFNYLYYFLYFDFFFEVYCNKGFFGDMIIDIFWKFFEYIVFSFYCFVYF